MKKTVLLCAAILVLSSLTAFAGTDFTVTVTDVAEDIINISGAAPVDSIVSILVLNPEKSGNDIDFSEDKSNSTVVQYFGSAFSAKGQFSADVKIVSKDGGAFSVTVQTGNKKSSDIFTFYPYQKKLEYVSRIAQQTDGDEAQVFAAELADIYSLSSNELYKNISIADIASTLCKMNKSEKFTVPEDVDIFYKKVLVVTAFNKQNPLAVKNGEICYTDILGISDSEWFDDYGKSLSQTGKNAVNAGLMGNNFTSIKEISDRFFDLMRYHALMNNAEFGSGHVERLLKKYSQDYTAAGFKISLFEKSDRKRQITGSLMSSNAENLTELATKFNALLSDGEKSNSNTSLTKPTRLPSGGVTSNFTGTTAVPDTTEKSVEKKVFGDMSGVEWANEAVEALYKKGIIAGRTESTFCPLENVTRAEFVKMLAEALNLPENMENISFEDVSEGAWFAPYIKRASTLVCGDGKKFMPNDYITREDAAVIIFRALKTESANPEFDDNPEISDYALEAVGSLYKAEIMRGVGKKIFSPKSRLTRAQAAQLIFNIIDEEVSA